MPNFPSSSVAQSLTSSPPTKLSPVEVQHLVHQLVVPDGNGHTRWVSVCGVGSQCGRFFVLHDWRLIMLTIGTFCSIATVSSISSRGLHASLFNSYLTLVPYAQPEITIPGIVPVSLALLASPVHIQMPSSSYISHLCFGEDCNFQIMY